MSSRYDSDIRSHDTAFRSLNSSLSDEIDERKVFAALSSIYRDREFSTDDITRNLRETDQEMWGVFGSLVSKDMYERTENGDYRLTEKGLKTARAVDEEETLQSIATPEGYTPSGYSARIKLFLKPEENVEEKFGSEIGILSEE